LVPIFAHEIDKLVKCLKKNYFSKAVHNQSNKKQWYLAGVVNYEVVQLTGDTAGLFIADFQD
jgi:hypothetical protein